MKRIAASRSEPPHAGEVTGTDAAKSHSKRLRQQATPPERKLWNLLRPYRDRGLNFRRQHPLGSFIADFYCSAAHLVVEIDGAHHAASQARARDTQRDAWMSSQGLMILRFSVSELERDTDAVVTTILHTAEERRKALGRS